MWENYITTCLLIMIQTILHHESVNKFMVPQTCMSECGVNISTKTTTTTQMTSTTNEHEPHNNNNTLIKIGVGSKNPAKVSAVKTAFESMGFDQVDVTSMEVPSGVSDQPFSDEETVQGALNRARGVMQKATEMGEDLDYAIGLEGGVHETNLGLFLCNWGAIVNKSGQQGVGAGHRVLLPEAIAGELRTGRELGSVIDEWASGSNIRNKEGALGVLTRNHITRSSMFRDVVFCAFAAFFHPNDYKN